MLLELTGNKRSVTTSYVSVPFREKLLLISEEFHLKQLVTKPTRGTNILDLFFTSHPDLVMSCQTTPSISDHNVVIAEISTQASLVKKLPREIFLYHKVNWNLIRERILEVCERYFDLNSSPQRKVDENWKFICENCLQVVQELVPKKTIGSKFHLHWINNTLKRLIKRNRELTIV